MSFSTQCVQVGNNIIYLKAKYGKDRFVEIE